MLKQIAWNTFKNTGDINTMLELIQVDKVNNVKLNMKNVDLEVGLRRKQNENLTRDK